MKNWILLGASRGLGKAFSNLLISNEPQSEIKIASRKSEWSMDFSKKEKWPIFIDEILTAEPTHIVYFAGGGAYGSFQSKKWPDHEWAFKVNFEFPAFLIHSVLRHHENIVQQSREIAAVCSDNVLISQQPQKIIKMCFIGSAIAENKPDPGAASYAAAKHALRGLITSLQEEKPSLTAIQIFSPGYIDTEMLPSQAWPRKQEGLVKSADTIATELYDFLKKDFISTI